MAMKTVTVLKRAKKLIETKGWTQGWFAKDRGGTQVNYDSANAVCFCIAGAVYRTTGYSLAEGSCEAMDALKNVAPSQYRDSLSVQRRPSPHQGSSARAVRSRHRQGHQVSATSKLRRRLRRKVKRDEPLTQGQEQAFLRLMKNGETVTATGVVDGCEVADMAVVKAARNV
jgi:hypothetical protein